VNAVAGGAFDGRRSGARLSYRANAAEHATQSSDPCEKPRRGDDPSRGPMAVDRAWTSGLWLI